VPVVPELPELPVLELDADVPVDPLPDDVPVVDDVLPLEDELLPTVDDVLPLEADVLELLDAAVVFPDDDALEELELVDDEVLDAVVVPPPSGIWPPEEQPAATKQRLRARRRLRM